MIIQTRQLTHSSKNGSASSQSSPVLDETHTHHDESPRDSNRSDENSRLNSANEQCGGQLDNEIEGKEDEERNGVSCSDAQSQLLIHALDPGISHVCPINQGPGVECCKPRKDPPIYAPHDASIVRRVKDIISLKVSTFLIGRGCLGLP